VSAAFPHVAGLLLTGGLQPAENVQRLLAGLRRNKVSILSVPMDTFETALAVNRVESTILPGDDRKIAAALGVFEHNVDIKDLQQRIAVHQSERMTPLMFEYELMHRAKSERKHIVLPEGSDERILRAAEILTLRGVADLTLLGNPDKIRQRIGELGLQLDGIDHRPGHSPKRDEYAAIYFELRKHKGISEQMAHGRAGGRELLRHPDGLHRRCRRHGVRCRPYHPAHHPPVLRDHQDQARTKLVSSVFFMCLADRVLGLRRLRRQPQPDAEQLADIAITSAGTAAPSASSRGSRCCPTRPAPPARARTSSACARRCASPARGVRT
jgi:phosphate acetyltransferase